MPEDPAHRIFRFGAFEANEAAGELRKHGIRIKLHSQPFRLLLMLLDKPSEVVTREQMRQQLWGNGTFVDFDHGLNTAVNKIREALDDPASTPRYVETVSGKGYRFIAPVVPARSSAPPAAVAVTSVEAAPANSLLTVSEELPTASRTVVRTLLLSVQAMYAAFYLGALANLPEIHDIFIQADLLPPAVLMTILVVTAAILIPIRLFLFAAVAFDFQNLASKFGKLFPALLLLDLAWGLSPFLLIHHVPIGLALGISAALLYLPFAQRSLILMYTDRRNV